MRTLVLIDLQNDFCPGGALAVPEGDQTVHFANEIMPRYELVIASQDAHPAGHKSFASVHGRQPGETIMLQGRPQILWPDHCVDGTAGQEFHPALNVGGIKLFVKKGTSLEIDSYSAFFDNARLKQTELQGILKRYGVEEIDLMGLATDYCVKFTALDALSLGIKTNLLLPGCRGVGLASEDISNALAEIKAQGGCLID